jgi:hypothetical protein
VGIEDSKNLGFGIPVSGAHMKARDCYDNGGTQDSGHTPVWNGPVPIGMAAGGHVEGWTADLGVVWEGKTEALAQFLITALTHILATHNVNHILGDIGRVVGNAL